MSYGHDPHEIPIPIVVPDEHPSIGTPDTPALER
jgi:hypothetical protein